MLTGRPASQLQSHGCKLLPSRLLWLSFETTPTRQGTIGLALPRFSARGSRGAQGASEFHSRDTSASNRNKASERTDQTVACLHRHGPARYCWQGSCGHASLQRPPHGEVNTNTYQEGVFLHSP